MNKRIKAVFEPSNQKVLFILFFKRKEMEKTNNVLTKIRKVSCFLINETLNVLFWMIFNTTRFTNDTMDVLSVSPRIPNRLIRRELKIKLRIMLIMVIRRGIFVF